MGKGGGAPSEQRVTSTNIPEYAEPYVSDVLGRAQALTTQKPYETYGGQRVAGFTPMQAQAFQNIAGQQVTPQIIDASNLAAQAGIQGLGAQGQYARQATSPQAMGAYMSPYMQNVVDVQKREAVRDYGQQLQKQRSQAAGMGAFGGSRQAIMEAEGARNLQQGLGDIQTRGLQGAYDQARQAQQFGATLGIQGLGAGMQGASTLGQLGAQQFSQQAGINQALATAGAQQQALQQQGLDVGYQDFLAQQQYPYQQLAFMQSMYNPNATPLQQMQSAYSNPSLVSQAAGLGAAGVGLYGMGKSAGVFKEGGQVGIDKLALRNVMKRAK